MVRGIRAVDVPCRLSVAARSSRLVIRLILRGRVMFVGHAIGCGLMSILMERMMRTFLVVFVCMIGIFGGNVYATDSISLASWNVRNISDSSRSDAELGIIALILFRYDFIAMQEVLDEEVIKRLQRILKDDFQVSYDIVVSGPVGHSKKERYAFIWRHDRIAQIAPPSFYADVGDKFEREPFCGHFKAQDFDWTICTIHVLFGSSEADRRPELRLLDDVYRTERDAGSERDIMICGDFNFDPDDEGWDQLKAEDEIQAAIHPPAKTTIADVSLYDNCWWPRTSKEIRAGSGDVYEFDELMYPAETRKEANRLTSDHRPISITIDTVGEDDD